MPLSYTGVQVLVIYFELKLFLLQMQSEAVYAVEVLLCCSTESCRGAPKAAPKPPPSGDKGEMQVTERGRARGRE